LDALWQDLARILADAQLRLNAEYAEYRKGGGTLGGDEWRCLGCWCQARKRCQATQTGPCELIGSRVRLDRNGRRSTE